MIDTNEFLVIFTLLYFNCGLAFFSMGLAMVLETRRVPLLAGPRTLHPFSAFFFASSVVSWLEMMFLLAAWSGYTLVSAIYWLHFLLLAISFSCLLIFSVRAFHPKDRKSHPVEKYITWGLIFFYLLIIVIIMSWQDASSGNLIASLTRFARYGLAVPGEVIAAWSLWKISQSSVALANHQLRISLRIVSVCFGLFGIIQIFNGYNHFFVSGGFNQSETGFFFSFYLQLAYTVLALVMTMGLIRVSQLVEDERLRQFDAAQQARLEAMRRIENELVEREAMRRELLRHIVLAQEDERARIARELHDETAQFLTAFSLHLATMQNLITNKTKLSELLDYLQKLSKEMSQGIYRMVNDLRPAHLDDLGLTAALQALTDETREAGLEVRFEIDGQAQRLDPVIETVIFRIAQEALTNVIKHAQCPQATLSLRTHSGQITLHVLDRGIGFNPHQKPSGEPGWGLVGMRERAESVGGLLNIYTAPQEGTLIEVTIPLNGGNGSGKRSNI